MNIAVIIPVYNAAATIQRCVDGILPRSACNRGIFTLLMMAQRTNQLR